MTSACSPSDTGTRRLSASRTSIVSAAAPRATEIPAAEASVPQTTPPAARLACCAMTFIDTARARTQAGEELCVAAERLANTPTHAAPAAAVPASVSTVKGETAMRASAAA